MMGDIDPAYQQVLNINNTEHGVAWTGKPFMLVGAYVVNLFMWGTANGATLQVQVSPFTKRPPAGVAWEWFENTDWRITGAGAQKKMVTGLFLSDCAIRVIATAMTTGTVLNYSVRAGKT